MKSRMGPTTSYIVKNNFLLHPWTFSSLLVVYPNTKLKLGENTFLSLHFGYFFYLVATPFNV